MSQIMKSATITAEVPHLKCDKLGCDAVTPAGLVPGWTRHHLISGSIVAAPASMMFNEIDGSYLVRDEAKHLCPKHSALFAKFVENAS
jgi:hypothetical protein